MDRTIHHRFEGQQAVVAGLCRIGRQDHAVAGDRPHVVEIPAEIQRGLVRGPVEAPPHEQAPVRQCQGIARTRESSIPVRGSAGNDIGIQYHQTRPHRTSCAGERSGGIEQGTVQPQGVHRTVGTGIPGRGPVRMNGVEIQGRQARAGLATDAGEIPAYVEQSFACVGQRPHRGVGIRIPGARRAIGQRQSRQAIAGLPRHSGEIPAGIDLVSRHQQSQYPAIRIRLPVRPYRAVPGGHGRQPLARFAAHTGKVPAHVQGGPIRCQHQGPHRCVGTGIPGQRRSGNRIQGRQACAGCAADVGEVPACVEHGAISGQGQGVDGTIRCRIPKGIHAAVGAQMEEIAARHTRSGELPAYEPAPCTIGDHRIHRALDTGIGPVQ